LDFTSPYTVVWTYNCNKTAIGTIAASSCEDAPTLTNNGFNPNGVAKV